MSFKAMFVAIGGKSGVGKTTLIKNLIMLYPNIFMRPVSYTTRPKRAGEDNSEYIFVTEDRIKTLHKHGQLANFDFNYGNYYAMDRKNLLQDLNGYDVFIIKEIHPKYHGNIKKLTCNHSISVLVKGLDVETESRGRNAEDDCYYNLHKDNEFDLVYMYDKNFSPEVNAKYFYKRLVVYINFLKMFPPATIIDTENFRGYVKAATQFTEEKRITTKNFHKISEVFWRSFLRKLRSGEVVLELGPGNGWLRNSFLWPSVDYHCVDIASNMQSVSNKGDSFVASARSMPIMTESIDCVVASLADPYFYPEMLCEVNRILKEGGRFAVTLPDKEWADNLRGSNNHKTSFLLDDGETATVYSFTFSDEQLAYLIDECGFSICQLIHLQGSALSENKVSRAITCAAEKACKSINDLNIITVLVLKKERTLENG